MKFEARGAAVTVNPDGSVAISTHSGELIDIGKEGETSIGLKKISSVGIYNLMEVENHAITNIVGSVSHYVRFFGGGEVRFAYNNSGQLIELAATNVIATVSSESEIMFKRNKSE